MTNKDYRTWYQKYYDEYENVVTNLPINGGVLETHFKGYSWYEIYCIREQLWAEREGLA